MGKNKVKVSICGAEYVLVTDDDESYVKSVADEVEKYMNEVMKSNPHVSMAMAAVLAALSFGDDRKKAVSNADNLRSQIKDYLEDSSHARTEADEARREIERMKREIQTLRMRLSEPDTGASRPQAAQQPAQMPQGRPAVSGGMPVSRPQQPGQPMPRPQQGASVPQARVYGKPEPGVKPSDDIMSFFEVKDNGSSK